MRNGCFGRAAANFETAEFQLYGALAHAAARDFASDDQRRQHFEALVGHHKQLEVWAQHNPITFENRAAIVGAEIARIEGRVLEAQDLYEKAVRSAHTHGFVHNEAIANERAGCFYAARGFEKIATTYLRDARNCYLRWGAEGKVRQLEQLYPHLRADKPISEPNTTIQTSVERLDLATVMKVSEALSGEIVLEKLIDTLMRTAIEHAGAERGVLILPRGDEYRIEAEVTTSSDKVEVHLRQASVTAADLPESVFRYVLRTKESVLLHDASGENPFSADDYIRAHHARSVLCLPILKQSQAAWDAVPGKQPDDRRLHPRPNGSAEAAGIGGRHLDGERAPVPGSCRTRGQNPAPGGCQHHRNLLLGSQRQDSRSEQCVSSHGGIRPRGSRIRACPLDGPDAAGVARS